MSNQNQPENIAPDYIDGAKVLKWAWSGQKPFWVMYSSDNTEFEEIYGIAICQYEKSKHIYSFSCDNEWETIQDAPHNTLEDAVLPNQYQDLKIIWNDK